MLSLSVSEPVTFRGRKGQSFRAQPVTVELARFARPSDRGSRAANAAEWKKQTQGLFRSEEAGPNELVHALAAIYDTCLPEVPLQSIYRILLAEGSRTILLLRDTTEILEEWENVASRQKDNSEEINNNPLNGPKRSFHEALKENGTPPSILNYQHSKSDTVSEPDEESLSNHTFRRDSWKSWHGSRNLHDEDPIRPLFGLTNSVKSDVESHGDTPFSDVFSDSEDASESLSEMEEEEDQEDFTRGMEAFVRSAVNRKQDRKVATENNSLRTSHVGLEHRLIGCASFQKNYRIPGTKVVHLSLMAVRKRFRKSGIGKLIIKRLKSPQVVGPYDALVVQADRTSYLFFQKNGFTDDIILNSRFKDLEEVRDNCKPMCYLPPFDGHYPPLLGLQEWSSPDALSAMEEEIDRWRQKSLEAHQAQVTCMTRLHQEVFRLHGLLKKQEATIQFLRRENQKLQIRLNKAEKRSTKNLLEALEKEANEFERLCTFRLSTTANSVSTANSTHQTTAVTTTVPPDDVSTPVPVTT